MKSNYKMRDEVSCGTCQLDDKCACGLCLYGGVSADDAPCNSCPLLTEEVCDSCDENYSLHQPLTLNFEESAP